MLVFVAYYQNYDDVELIGVYSTNEKANIAIDKYIDIVKSNPVWGLAGTKKENYYVYRYEVDE